MNKRAFVTKIELEPHPNADRLDLAVVGGYRCVVGKGSFADGDLVAYIPEGNLLPPDVVEEMGLKLAGSDGRRIKAIRLRGQLSEGIVYPLDGNRLKGSVWAEGDDPTDALEVEEYVPYIPPAMQGDVEHRPEMTLNFDVEAWKRYPDVLVEGEPVVYTEKLHGTMCGLTIMPDGVMRAWSKGMGSKGLVMQDNEANRSKNLYVRTLERVKPGLEAMAETLRERMPALANGSAFRDDERSGRVVVLGEIVGRGVQDLHYGLASPALYIFDINVGGTWMNFGELADAVADQAEHFSLVPTLDEGPFSAERLARLAGGKSTLADHLREGVVARAEPQRRDDEIGRAMLKYVSDDYLSRKGGTEYN